MFTVFRTPPNSNGQRLWISARTSHGEQPGMWSPGQHQGNGGKRQGDAVRLRNTAPLWKPVWAEPRRPALVHLLLWQRKSSGRYCSAKTSQEVPGRELHCSRPWLCGRKFIKMLLIPWLGFQLPFARAGYGYNLQLRYQYQTLKQEVLSSSLVCLLEPILSLVLVWQCYKC